MLSAQIDVEHQTWDTILSSVTFVDNMAVQETTGFNPFLPAHVREATTTRDGMLPHHPRDENDGNDVAGITQRAEEARQKEILRTKQQECVDNRRYDL